MADAPHLLDFLSEETPNISSRSVPLGTAGSLHDRPDPDRGARLLHAHDLFPSSATGSGPSPRSAAAAVTTA